MLSEEQKIHSSEVIFQILLDVTDRYRGMDLPCLADQRGASLFLFSDVSKMLPRPQLGGGLSWGLPIISLPGPPSVSW